MAEDISQATVERIVKEDHRLEEAATKSTRALMQHRWHWTLNEDNPERMPIREYARAVARSYTQIAKYVHGYVLLVENEQAQARGDSVHTVTPTDAYELAHASEERRAATEAVMQARGISAVNARQHHGDEVRHVRDIARDRAEERGTSVVEEAAAAAQAMWEEAEREKRAEQARKQREQERKQRHTFRYNEVESQLGKAREHLLKAARVIEGVPFDPEERDLLSVTLNNLRRMVDMMDEAIVGKRRPDWGEKIQLVGGGLEE